jgi:hypothetical protein
VCAGRRKKDKACMEGREGSLSACGEVATVVFARKRSPDGLFKSSQPRHKPMRRPG